MNFTKLRDELCNYYRNKADKNNLKFSEKVNKILDDNAVFPMTSYQMKAYQYEKIAYHIDPVLFYNNPFYYETGTLGAMCDGRHWFNNIVHPGGWTASKNSRLYIDQDPELHKIRTAQMNEQFYLICGAYNDTVQHFNFNYRPIFEKGLKGVYMEAVALLNSAEKQEEKEFLEAVCAGMTAIRDISVKFSQKAKDMAESAPDTASKERMLRIANSAERTPWEAPKSFYEALNTYAFLRKALGSLEGVGPNTFGRVDMDLYPFYKKDIENGKLTEQEAFELISQFLITFDCHYDHDMKMVGYADHELENTYTLGGCDLDGNHFYNELTRMFLTATREENIIFPKIKCRYSQNSPKEYLEQINISVLKGSSVILYQNDDSCIPALVSSGRTLQEARDYIVTGCWGIMCQECEKYDGGNYLNLLKAFEFSLYNPRSRIENINMYFEPIDHVQSFEEIYDITINNFRTLFKERIRITKQGGQIWDKVDPLPIFSSTLKNCLKNKTDYTAGGAKYRDEQLLCIGFPNIIDSLLAIKELCFERKKYTLKEFLSAMRNNWKNNEIMRIDATLCHGWGDGSEASCSLAKKLSKDLYALVCGLEGSYGGKIHLGHVTYTEILFWGKKTLATPDGRKNGDLFSQGLTPSRLKKIPSVTSVINSLACLDSREFAGNSVINIILPSNKMNLNVCDSFLRTAATTSMQSLQLNCVTKEELLDAQKHPEKHRDLIVRVTGFSAKFTSLSDEWQNEVLSRNFYE
ncbi:MAG: pyruvate formate lyase family protein [Acutalibacteraceae bacterium]|nr:pyruvate formate lyase family protein [Acutalibacteraceae bacterium]